MLQPPANTLTVYGLFRQNALHHPNAVALIDGAAVQTYGELLSRVDSIAAGLALNHGVGRGDRVAILSENRAEYVEVELACAKLGAIAACQNWRLSAAELTYCITLVAPALVVASPRYEDLARTVAGKAPVAPIGNLAGPGSVAEAATPDDIVVIMYTSGTTGFPKAAAVCHGAEIARMCGHRMDLGGVRGDALITWAPLFHMGGTDHALAMLMSGGKVILTDGFDIEAIGSAIAEHQLGWFLVLPGIIDRLLDHLKSRQIVPKGVRAIGAMADLVPKDQLIAVTRYFNAPYVDTFGATETGIAPLSGAKVGVAEAPAQLAKKLSNLCEFRLVDDDWNTVEDGIGEACVRSPMLFSGYWADDAATAQCFRDGWYRMGDLLRRTDDGYLFAGRSKYMIKTGGENVYPAEIERLLMADARVAEAVVVRRPDATWGEVPVVFIARRDDSFDEAQVQDICRASLAKYKWPKQVHFVDLERFERNHLGKILREPLEAAVSEMSA